MKKKIVAISGGFDPWHIGHLKLFEEASKMGKLVVIVNDDNFLMRKKGFIFMALKDRIKMLSVIKYVDKVIPCIDKDNTVCNTLKKLKPDIFCNGADRTMENIPEIEICKKLGTKVAFGIGGNSKAQSSSWLIGNLILQIKKNPKLRKRFEI